MFANQRVGQGDFQQTPLMHLWSKFFLHLTFSFKKFIKNLSKKLINSL